MRIYKFITDWILIFAILGGIGGYFLYTAIPALAPTHAVALQVVQTLQPLLIFAMLFLTFCKVDLHHLHLCRYHWWLLLFQTGMYVALAAVALMLPADAGTRVVVESAMICFICPTATAGAVIVRKLGGSAAHITTYTILINLAVSLVIPATVPLVHPSATMGFCDAAVLILGKVFPLLLLPLVGAWLLKQFVPGVYQWAERHSNLSFHLWVVALALATAVTTRYIMHTTVSLHTQLWIVVFSAIACVSQFAVGRFIGRSYGEAMTAGQSLGQKNTVLAIWMGYTFFTPITSVAGGFYSIWHNVINSIQLYRHKRSAESKK